MAHVTYYGPEDKKKALKQLLGIGAFAVPTSFLATMAYRKNALMDYLLGNKDNYKASPLEIPVFSDKKDEQEINPLVEAPVPKQAGATADMAAEGADIISKAIQPSQGILDSLANKWPTGELTHPLWSWFGIPAAVGTAALGSYVGHGAAQNMIEGMQNQQSEEELEQAKADFREALREQMTPKFAEDNISSGDPPATQTKALRDFLKSKFLGVGNPVAGGYLTGILGMLGLGGAAGYYYGRKGNKYLQVQKALKERAADMRGTQDPYARIKLYDLNEEKKERPTL